IPALFIRLPAMMKNGTARSGKLSMPLIIRWTTTNGGRSPVSRIYTSADPAMAIATGTPEAIRPRNEPSNAGVMARTPTRSQPGRSYSTLHCNFRPLEHAVALPPMDDEDLDRPRTGKCEPDHADPVHDVHRQVDDGHLVVAHLLHHGPGEVDRVTEEGNPDHVHDHRQDATRPRRQQPVEEVDMYVPIGPH